MKTYETRAMDTWDIIAKKTVFFSAGVVLNVPDIDAESAEFAENLPPWKRQEGAR